MDLSDLSNVFNMDDILTLLEAITKVFLEIMFPFTFRNKSQTETPLDPLHILFEVKAILIVFQGWGQHIIVKQDSDVRI